MGRLGFWAAFAAWVLTGCSAGDSAMSVRDRPMGITGGGAGQGAAGGGAGQASSPSGFGNSMTPAPATGGTGAGAAGAAGGCAVGQFCAPTAPDGNCGSLTLETEVEVVEHPGNVLLVFDTSQSMQMEWNGQPRWEAAGPAIASALMPLADRLTIGTVFFPRSDPNAPAQCVDPTGITCIFVPGLVVAGGTCGVTPITSMDQIAFMPGAQFLTTFNGANGAPPYAPVPGGRTPLKEGLIQAQAAIAGATLEGITSVVIITDGDPNCEWDATEARQIVADWNTAGIKTYVLGLPGTTGAGDAILTDLAVTGGTMTYITPTDAAGLEMKLREIATETVRSGFNSCEIAISPAAEAPEKLHLIVNESGMDQDVARDLAADYSWAINGDGSLVTLEGRLCEDAMSGRFASLRFEFGCVDLPPLEPPPPVE